MGIGTTEAAIRNRMAQVIEALEPTLAADDRFELFEGREKADFVRWCQENRAGALRRVHVRVKGGRELPTSTSVDIEELKVTVIIMVAYPQDARAGDLQAYSRDELAAADIKQINRATGLVGRDNFRAPNPEACCVSSALPDREEGEGIDFWTLEHTLAYVAEY